MDVEGAQRAAERTLTQMAAQGEPSWPMMHAFKNGEALVLGMPPEFTEERKRKWLNALGLLAYGLQADEIVFSSDVWVGKPLQPEEAAAAKLDEGLLPDTVVRPSEDPESDNGILTLFVKANETRMQMRRYTIGDHGEVDLQPPDEELIGKVDSFGGLIPDTLRQWLSMTPDRLIDEIMGDVSWVFKRRVDDWVERTHELALKAASESGLLVLPLQDLEGRIKELFGL
jgi:hypothetical protein